MVSRAGMAKLPTVKDAFDSSSGLLEFDLDVLEGMGLNKRTDGSSSNAVTGPSNLATMAETTSSSQNLPPSVLPVASASTGSQASLPIPPLDLLYDPFAQQNQLPFLTIEQLDVEDFSGVEVRTGDKQGPSLVKATASGSRMIAAKDAMGKKIEAEKAKGDKRPQGPSGLKNSIVITVEDEGEVGVGEKRPREGTEGRQEGIKKKKSMGGEAQAGGEKGEKDAPPLSAEMKAIVQRRGREAINEAIACGVTSLRRSFLPNALGELALIPGEEARHQHHDTEYMLNSVVYSAASALAEAQMALRKYVAEKSTWETMSKEKEQLVAEKEELNKEKKAFETSCENLRKQVEGNKAAAKAEKKEWEATKKEFNEAIDKASKEARRLEEEVSRLEKELGKAEGEKVKVEREKEEEEKKKNEALEKVTAAENDARGAKKKIEELEEEVERLKKAQKTTSPPTQDMEKVLEERKLLEEEVKKAGMYMNVYKACLLKALNDEGFQLRAEHLEAVRKANPYDRQIAEAGMAFLNAVSKHVTSFPMTGSSSGNPSSFVNRLPSDETNTSEKK